MRLVALILAWVRKGLIVFIVSLFAGCATPTPKQVHVAPAPKFNPYLQAANAHVRLGLDYVHRRQFKAAKQTLLLAQAESPEDPATWYALAYYFEAVKAVKKAKRYYLKAITLAPNSGAAQNNYATFLCRQGQYEPAIRHFLIAVRQPKYLDVATAYQNAGLCALQAKQYRVASHYFQLALSHNPQLKVSRQQLKYLMQITKKDSN